MRRVIVIVLTLSLILSLAACSCTPGTDGSKTTGNNGTASASTTKTAGTRLPKAEAVLKGKIVELYDKALLLAGTGASDLYTISNTLDVYDADNKITDLSALKAGQNVEIGYSGVIMESYPAQPGSPIYVKIVEQGDDMVGFYQTVLNDLWNVDKGLNSDINTLAFDLSKVTNLSDSEKSALVYVVGNSHNVHGIKGTFDELSEQGYIDKDKLFFKNGILFTIELSDVTENSFMFDVKKWRSGDGAYYFIDCKAVRSDNGWSYTIGSEAIS